jgi:ABC-type branched-subunit amino acid transport system ATPase component/ABC-type branched-subunit amino acid transport system permease subunit
MILFLYLAPQLGGSEAFRLSQYEKILCFLVVAVALNLAVGYAGQYLLGITAVFAFGAYGAALVAQHHPAGVGLVAMSVIGIVVGIAAGFVLGLPALRIGGFYLALVSLFAALAIPTVAQEWSFAGGEAGITLYAVDGFKPQLDGEGLYLTTVSILLLVTLLSWAIVHSRVGHRFVVLDTSEQLAASIGISGYWTKVLAILISSGIAGGAGGIYVYSQQFFAPSSTSVGLAILLVAALVIGGMGTIWGPIVGGLIVLGTNEFLTNFQLYNGFLFGGLLLVFAVFMPNGLIARIRSSALASRLKPSNATTPGLAKPQLHQLRASSAPLLARGDSTPIGSLEVVGARRSFGGVVAVDGIDIHVVPGTIHGLIGSNGSGKTTLLNLISGFYRLDAGQIRVDGKVLDARPHMVARMGIARTFQTPRLMLNATVLDNVIPAVELRVRCSDAESVFRLPRGVRTSREVRDQAHEALEVLGLGHLAQQSAGALPHGTRRLIELARAMAMRPGYLLLDEPAAGLGAGELESLVQTIQDLARADVGVLLVEHNVPTVLELARDVTVLHQGRRIFTGTPRGLVADSEVADAFIGVDIERLDVRL